MKKILFNFSALLCLTLQLNASSDEVSSAIRNQDIIFVVNVLSKKSYSANEKSEFLRLALEQVNRFQSRKIYNSPRAILRTLLGASITALSAYIINDAINNIYLKDKNHYINIRRKTAFRLFILSFPDIIKITDTDKFKAKFTNDYCRKLFSIAGTVLGSVGILAGLWQVEKGVTMADDKKSLEKAKAIANFLMKISA